jgi:hypothetical protein
MLRRRSIATKQSAKHQTKQKARTRWMINELLRLGRLKQAALCCSTLYRTTKSTDDGLLLGEIWARMGNRRNACVKHLTRLINKLKKHPITQIAIESIGVCAHLYVRLGQNVAAETSFVLQCQYAHELHGQLHVSTSDCFMTACAFYNQRAQDPKMKETERKKYRTLACQFAGKALLVRINVLGELDKRTASCHYNLGLLLRANGDLDSAYRELLFAREGRKNAFGENSLEVAEAEISLGITPQQNMVGP